MLRKLAVTAVIVFAGGRVSTCWLQNLLLCVCTGAPQAVCVPYRTCQRPCLPPANSCACLMHVSAGTYRWQLTLLISMGVIALSLLLQVAYR